ncbi:MAG: DUF2236 domain-containing protein [Sphingomonas sp.]|nr:MAG: DUF2236 domain-containing protein [Sphingomonas sp.]
MGLRDQAKSDIVRHVRTMFNDTARGEQPVARSDDALFPPSSMIWRVHGDVASMMVGGVSALLLQMLHPAVLAGVWDHSNFRTDMLGRLRRTARFIAVTTYGRHTDAEAAMDRVRSVHRHVSGVLPDGTTYRADDPALLAWVHISEAWCFLAAWQRYGNHRLTLAEADRYFDEFAGIGVALGADPVPRDRTATGHALQMARPHLVADARTKEVARLVLGQSPANPLAIPVQRFVMQAAVDLLPAWAREMHRLPASPPLARPFVRAGTLQLARTLRWAFKEK